MRYHDALKTYWKAADIAHEQGDSETLAFIVWNVGNALQELGDHEQAKDCLEHALEMFEHLGMHAEVAQVHFAIARGMILRHEYNEGIAGLQKNRDEFLQLEMPVVAAQVAIEAANALLLAGRGRWIQQLCREAIATFVRANLPREAQKALAYLQEAASSQQRAWIAHRPSDGMQQAIIHVKEFLSRLEHDPDLWFSEPEATPDP